MTRGPIPRFDLYEELEVSRLASAEVIEAAYRTLVKRHHPDVSAGHGAATDADRIKRLNVAHGWLTDPARRRRYDDATADAAASDAGLRAPASHRRPSDAEAAPAPAAPAQESGPMGFGPNSAEVRQFLADLRPIGIARATEILDAKASAPSTPYAEARGVALRASRAGRHDQWLLARDAATVIAQGKLGDWPQAKEVATIVADVAGAIVVRDLIPLADFQAVLLPWTWRPEAVVDAEPGPGVRAVGLAGLGMVTGAMGAVGAAGAAVRGRRPPALGIAASALVAVVALSAIVFGGPKPQQGVAALTDAPSALTAVASPAAPFGSPGVAGESVGPSGSASPATGPESVPPSTPTVEPAASTIPTPRITARPTAPPTPVPTAAPTLVPTPVPTGTPSPTAEPPPTASPPALCTVVNLVGVNTSNAQLAWTTGGFTGTVLFSPITPPQYKIGWQSLTAGTDVPCTSDITVQLVAP